MARGQLGPPYGPPANLATIFRAWRDRGLPDRVDREWFERIGLSGNLTSRNLHALAYLRLVDDDGRPTEHAERLRTAAADAFAGTLATLVRTAYAKVWTLRDPAGESRTRIEDAFRDEAPVAQRSRMVACFLGLCRQAGIIPGAIPTLPRRRDYVSAPPPSIVPLVPITAGTVAESAERPAGIAPDGARIDAIAQLVRKLPDFDPTWPDRLKDKWFDLFAELRADLHANAGTAQTPHTQ